MARDTEHKPTPNLTASRIVAETDGNEKSQPAEVESAGLAWFAHIQNVDERGISLLKATLEAEAKLSANEPLTSQAPTPEILPENARYRPCGP